MNKKYLIIGGAIFILLVVVVAVLWGGRKRAADPQDQPIELVWWKTFNETEDVQPLITAYQADHQNVRITFAKKDIGSYEQELVDALASGQGPDIFSIHNDWLPKHQDKLAPMPDSEMSVRAYQETFVDVASADFITGAQIYALPLSVDVLALYYNKDILNSAGIAQAPRTWPEAVAAVEKITRQERPGEFSMSGISLGTAANVNRSVDILLLLMLQNGTQFYTEDRQTARFDQSLTAGEQTFYPGQLALEFYTQFAQAAKKSYTWNARSDLSLDAFAAGRLGMMLSYAYMGPRLQARSPNLNWAVAPVPQPDSAGLKINFANYWGEAVSKQSAQQAVAWDFLNFISRKEHLQKYSEQEKLPSSRRDILEQQISDKDIGVFAEGALSARTVYKKDVAKFESVLVKMIEDVVLRNLRVEDAVRHAAQQANLLLRD